MNKWYFILLLFSYSQQSILSQTDAKIDSYRYEVIELDNAIFKNDPYWRGADGAATVDLGNGKLLWLFSDTFINPKGEKTRENVRMINNSVAVQAGYNLDSASISFHWKGTNRKPKSIFEIPGRSWFWVGHGTLIKDKLFIFLLEEISIDSGLGFEAIGWYLAIIDNPFDPPDQWSINYVQGPDTFGVIIGSSALWIQKPFIYVFGVKEPATHETYLLRYDLDKFYNGNLENPEWYVNNNWIRNIDKEPIEASLFKSQTEFSVHFDEKQNQFLQIQTYGFGEASIALRKADNLMGPWSKLNEFYFPERKNQEEFIYSANAHPELISDGLIISYNVNSFDFATLVKDQSIYFPKLIKLKIE